MTHWHKLLNIDPNHSPLTLTTLHWPNYRYTSLTLTIHHWPLLFTIDQNYTPVTLTTYHWPKLYTVNCNNIQFSVNTNRWPLLHTSMHNYIPFDPNYKSLTLPFHHWPKLFTVHPDYSVLTLTLHCYLIAGGPSPPPVWTMYQTTWWTCRQWWAPSNRQRWSATSSAFRLSSRGFEPLDLLPLQYPL